MHSTPQQHLGSTARLRQRCQHTPTTHLHSTRRAVTHARSSHVQQRRWQHTSNRVLLHVARSAQLGRDAAARQQQLLAELEQAVSAEDYTAALRIKAELTQLELQDPLTAAKAALDAAIAEERYADAAQLRDQLQQLEEANRPPPPDMTGVTTASDTVTDGVRVKVKSFYVPAQSRPELGQYFFAYSVTIANEGQRVVMLTSRHWIVTDATGKVDHVRGPGVVGEQPILEPGRSFEYQSACPLFTTHGCMEGEYEMVLLNEQGEWDGQLQVKIGRFGLIKPEMA